MAAGGRCWPGQDPALRPCRIVSPDYQGFSIAGILIICPLTAIRGGSIVTTIRLVSRLVIFPMGWSAGMPLDQYLEMPSGLMK